MGNWSPYSKEWEKQRINKKAAEARATFDAKPRPYQAYHRFKGTISYYWTLLVIRLRRLFDRKYREEMDNMEEETIKFFVDMVKDDE